MGLFDFLKPKKHPLETLRDNPNVRPAIVQAELERLCAQCRSLKAVGREQEAQQAAIKFLVNLAKDCVQKKFFESQFMLSLLVEAAIRLEEPKHGRGLLGKIIDFHRSVVSKGIKDAPALDLTQAYTDAGRLEHLIRESREEEYRCYWEATQAEPPPGCKQPASNRSKANAHDLAYSLCAVEAFKEGEWPQRRDWHDQKRREYAPECNWDDPDDRMRWHGL